MITKSTFAMIYRVIRCSSKVPKNAKREKSRGVPPELRVCKLFVVVVRRGCGCVKVWVFDQDRGLSSF